MAKKTINSKKSTKRDNKETKIIAKTSELILENGEKEPECIESSIPFISGKEECVATTDFPIFTEEEHMLSNNVGVFVEEECANVDFITNSIDIPVLENSNTFENMSMDLLLKYKDAVVSLIKDNQHLAEINKGYDYKIYSDAVSKINKLNRYLHTINNVIEKNIFNIEIE